MHLLIKAKLEAAREGATTIGREFLADTLLADGSTFGDHAVQEIAEARRIGRMPAQLLIEGPRTDRERGG